MPARGKAPLMLLDRTLVSVLALPRIVKRTIALAVDAGLCVLTVWIAISLRLGEWIPLSGHGWPAALASLAIALPIFVIFGLYRAVFRHASWDAIATISQAIVVYGVIYASVFTAIAIPGVPRTVGIIQPVLLLIAVGSSRALGRYVLGGRYRQSWRGKQRQNVLVYGAGSAGRQLARALADTQDTRVVGFLDDDRALQGSVIGRLPVWAPARVSTIVSQFEISEIFLAMPSVARTRRNEILQLIRSAGAAVRTLPGLLDIAQGNVTVSDIKPLEIEDLLGRDAVAPDQQMLERNIRGKTVMVTGAGGSIGSELCRQIIALAPSRLILVETSEFSLYALHKELGRGDAGGAPPRTELVPLLASVCDGARMRKIFDVWQPHTIYHAAAYKHVPLVEHNLIEGVRNNFLGTLECAELARAAGAESFVLVSTDKAVRPTSVMGASKRLAEMALQAIAAERPATCFSMVRFGNVLGSSGSVVPLFRQQIASGGPVTVTHREMTRYFMTIPEAAQLVIQAGAMAQGGEVFVLDMGEPVRIFELATRIIELSGLKVRSEADPFGDIEIAITSLRPGEKLYEELLIGENPIATTHPRVMMAREAHPSWTELRQLADQLAAAIDAQEIWRARAILAEMVPEYTPAAEVVDWMANRQEGGGAPVSAENVVQAFPPR
jgi:FlaA1/EpsC-like NDP-sugar epimerase